VWVLVGLAGLTGGAALAQPLIPPSRQYSTPAPERLDKNYGLPTLGMPGMEAPQKKVVVPKAPPPDPFKGMSSFASPDAAPSGTPDFFQKSPGVGSNEASDVPNFFQTPSDNDAPKSRRAQAASSTTETPLFTTSEGASTGDMTTGDTTTGGTTMGDTGVFGKAPTR